MTTLQWDRTGERRYETGVDHGVLYVQQDSGEYGTGVAWNGLTTVTESPSGAESNPQYADNIKYLDLQSAEEFGATIEAFTYPRDFAVCDGSARPVPGLTITQQRRRGFGFSYRTLVGNDVQGNDYGYKIHVVYGAKAAPSEKANATVNDSPEASAMSWEVTTTGVPVPGFKPTAHMIFDSTELPADRMLTLQQLLYGTAGTDARLPLPGELLDLFTAASITEVRPAAPTYNATTKVITIPNTTGVVYLIDGEPVTGTVTITKDTVVTARPATGYKFPAVGVSAWFVQFA